MLYIFEECEMLMNPRSRVYDGEMQKQVACNDFDNDLYEDALYPYTLQDDQS